MISPDSARLRVTDDDRLWLARAVEAEGEPRDLVAQTLVNRWAWLVDQGAFRASLGELVRQYAQPVNPRWFPDGDLAIAEMQRTTDPTERARLMQRAERRRDVFSRAQLFTQPTVAAVVKAVSGPITIPPGAVHYAPRTPARDRELVLLVDGPNAIYGVANGPRAHYWVDADLARQAVERTVGKSAIPWIFVGVFALFGAIELVKRKNPSRS